MLARRARHCGRRVDVRIGVLLEGDQSFSPGRAVELGDVIANGTGVSCGALLALSIRRLIPIL
jgi:VanZ family protein